MTLDQLKKGMVSQVGGFCGCDADAATVDKLREIGFAEGDEVELLHKGLLGGTPMSFRLNRTVIALRRAEAALILVEGADAAGEGPQN